MARTDKAGTRKADRLKARLPRGFQDLDAATLRAQRRMLETIREVFERYGFDPIETPAIEYTDALGKFLPDQDRPNEGVFSFLDDDEQWLSLRYDLTAPLARHVAENYDRLPKPYRTYRAGYVFRNEKPGPGRFRQFMQFDADTVGSPGVAADAEACMMAADVMEALGISRGDYVVRVNNRKVLDGVMEAIGVTDEGQKLAVLRAIDKYDRLGADGVRLLLGDGRKDESGDFTKGAGLTPEQGEILLAFLEIDVSHNPSDALVPRENPELSGMKGGILFAVPEAIARSELFAHKIRDNITINEGISELNEIRMLVESSGYGEDRIATDFSIVRGLEYYTGPVYEIELTFEIIGELGRPVRFGSVAGGGRYDGLVERFRGEKVPATGFSIGVSRLFAALNALGRIETGGDLGPVVVLVDRDEASVANAQKMVSELRAANIRSEMYLGGSRNFGPQMKYADRRKSPCVVIQGEDERARGVVQVKDLIEGARLSQEIESREEWREARPAQVEAERADLVTAVREILDRHR